MSYLITIGNINMMYYIGKSLALRQKHEADNKSVYALLALVYLKRYLKKAMFQSGISPSRRIFPEIP